MGCVNQTPVSVPPQQVVPSQSQPPSQPPAQTPVQAPPQPAPAPQQDDRYSELSGFGPQQMRNGDFSDDDDYRQYVESKRDFKKLPVRDVIIGMMIVDSRLHDDTSVFMQKKLDWRKYKISKIKLGVESKGYAGILQLQYKPINPSSKDPVVQGTRMNTWSADYLQPTKTITLENNEYIKSVVVRRGLIFDALGFKTTSGKFESVGGTGGEEFVYEVPAGYTIGPISLSAKSFVNGMQFDLVPLDSAPAKKPPSSPFIFDRDEQIFFKYLCRFLSCKEIFRNFRVCKKWAEFRKKSPAFWMRCINTHEKVLTDYTRELANKYNIAALKKILTQNPSKYEEKKQDYEISKPLISALTGFKDAKKFLVEVEAEFLSCTYQLDDCQFWIDFDMTSLPVKEVRALLRNQSELKTRKAKTCYLSRKITFYIQNKQNALTILEKTNFKTKANTTWSEAFMVEVKGCNFTVTPLKDTQRIPLQKFTKLNDGVYANGLARPMWEYL